MSSPSSPNSWTRTVILPRQTTDPRYLFRSPEGKLIFDQQWVGKLFNIISDRIGVDGAPLPDASALENAKAFVQVQLGDNLYIVSYLRSDGSPQLPNEWQTEWHALQKPNGDWCFVPLSQTTVSDDWPPAGLHNKNRTPAAQTTAAQTTAEPEKPESANKSQSEKKEEPEKPKEAKQGAEPNINHGNFGNSGDHGNFQNYPITNLPNYPISSPNDPMPNDEVPPKKADKFPPADILDFLELTIGEYLICSPAQRSVLALWILHTYTFSAAHFTPYLNIYSPVEESGKSTCMAILRSLCARPWWAAGTSPAIFKKRVSTGYPTVLLDNWQTVFRSSDKNQFTGFLLNGCDQARDVASVDPLKEKTLANLWQTFCPKAFAGMESLPPSLARHSIPIVLQRRKPQETVKSALNLLVPECAVKLTSWMQRWAKENEVRVSNTFESDEFQGDMWLGLSPHQQNCGKALMAVAEVIGGDWPMKAYEALEEIFSDYNESQFSPVQLLSDIRDAFAHLGNQERIFTAELLPYLHGLDHRTYYEWSKKGDPINAHALSALLRKHFGIYSRSQRRGKEKFRGYQQSDFQEAWERYLPPPQAGLPVPTEKSKGTISTDESTPNAQSSSPSKSTSSTPSVYRSKPAKSPLVSMSHSRTTAEKIIPKPMSRLKNFAAKTMRIFTAIWP